MSFQETGNKIPITSQELIHHCQKKLAEFDEMISADKTIPPNNPYTDKIIYVTKDGKTIMIPETIQKQAINIWYDKTGRNVPVMQQNAPTNPKMMKRNRLRMKKEMPDVHENKDYVRLIILVFAAILALYLFFKMGQTPNNNVTFGLNSEKLKYYLTK